MRTIGSHELRFAEIPGFATLHLYRARGTLGCGLRRFRGLLHCCIARNLPAGAAVCGDSGVCYTALGISPATLRLRFAEIPGFATLPKAESFVS